MSNRIYLLTTIALISFCVGCSSIGKNEAEAENVKEIVLDDNYKTNDKNEIIIDDKDFEGKDIPVFTENKAKQEPTKIADDGSQITTMYDGFGNKTETRFFKYHNRLDCIIVRTGVNGEKRFFVYSRSGDVKDLPANLAASVFTASADEIADGSGIYQTFKEVYKPTLTQNQPPKPMPTFTPPIQIQPAATPKPEENQNTEPIPAVVEKNQTDVSEENLKGNNEKTPSSENLEKE